MVVERRCLVAASAGVTVDVAFLQAAESSIELELALGEELEAHVATVVCFEASAEYELRLARIGVGQIREVPPRKGPPKPLRAESSAPAAELEDLGKAAGPRR